MTPEEELKLEQQRETIALQYKHKTDILNLLGKKLVYSNQAEAAQEIVTHFLTGATIVVLIAEPGVGKSGTILETIKILGEHNDDEKIIEAENMYNITGMSDKDWKEQLEKNLLPIFKNNVLHRGNLLKEQEKFNNLKNGFIGTDECHIAIGPKMTISKVLSNAGLLNVDVLKTRNIKLLMTSATPEGVRQDMEKWGENAKIVILKPGPIYKGFNTMLQEKRIIDAPLFSTQKDVEEILQVYTNRYQNTTPKWFPFRIKDIELRQLIHGAAAVLGWNVENHDSEDRIEHLDEIMKNPPEKHTIILIKEFWRASKRLIRDHVGGSYEPKTKKRDTTTTSQGLTARFCDNFNYEGDWLNPNLRPIHYCDKKAVEEYHEWFKNNCDYRKVIYTAHRIKSKNGRVKSKPTVIHPTNIEDMEGEVPLKPNVRTIKSKSLDKIKDKIRDLLKYKDKNITFRRSWLEVHNRFISTRLYLCNGGKKVEDLQNLSESEKLKQIFKESNLSKVRLMYGLDSKTNGYAIFPVEDDNNETIWYARVLLDEIITDQDEVLDLDEVIPSQILHL
jgi:hypothetical protein